MYSNDMTQLRAGLINYIGAIVKASGYKGKIANQFITAILVEEIFKLSQTEEATCDLYILKPFVKAIIFLLEQRCIELENLSFSANQETKIAIETSIKRYKEIVLVFENMINDL